MTAKLIGIDLGGTNIRAALVYDGNIHHLCSKRTNSTGTVEDVLSDIFEMVDRLFEKDVVAIGIGVPSVVDVVEGIVYDVQYIPAWKEVPLKAILEKRYGVPVFVNNDANCFALGEYYFGQGQGSIDMIGLTIGTGLGSGIILNKKLYAGRHCGAGEFGMVEYRDQFVEYYASGQFFQNVYGQNGQEVFERAKRGDASAIKMYEEFGTHLGNAIKMVLYTYDVSLLILGGSVREAFSFFEKTMFERIETFAYKNTIRELSIKVSNLENSGVLGAAALYFNDL